MIVAGTIRRMKEAEEKAKDGESKDKVGFAIKALNEEVPEQKEEKAIPQETIDALEWLAAHSQKEVRYTEKQS